MASGPAGVVSEFFVGVALVGRGFAYWARSPGRMALGLLPAAIVGVLVVAAVVSYLLNADSVTTAITSFADDWEPIWRDLLRVALGIALLVGFLALTARVYTAVTLLVGGPFFERIQQAVDRSIGGMPEGRGLGFGASLGATIGLIAITVVGSLAIALLGLIPVVGNLLAIVVGFWFTARGLSRELTLAPYLSRGLRGPERRAALRGRRARALGFGVAVQACFLVPLGAVAVMPSAVAGGALLVRQTLGEPDRTAHPVGGPPPGTV